MADPKDYVGLSVEELEDYIKKEFKDVLYSYPISVMEARAGIYLDVLEDDSLYLDTLNIFPAAQGQGKGKEILNILKTWADENKLSIYIKPAFLEDNPTFKGIETSAEKQVDNLFNYYKNNGWVDNPNFINLSSEEQAAQLSLSAGRDWGIETNDIYSPLVYTPEGVKVPELPKNPYKDDMISFAEKFNKEGKIFLEGYNQPILDEMITEVLKIEVYFGTSGFMEEDDWKKSKLRDVAIELENNGIHPNDVDDISKYIPRDKIPTPAEIFKGGVRNEFFTDGIVDMLSESAGSFYTLSEEGDELFPDNRPKRDYKLYHAISADSEKEIAERVAQYKKDHTGAIQGPPKALNYIKYTSEGERPIPGLDTPTNVVDDAPLLETRFNYSSDVLDVPVGEIDEWADDVIKPNKVFNPDSFIRLESKLGTPEDTAARLLKGEEVDANMEYKYIWNKTTNFDAKELYERILKNRASDEDITKFFIYLASHSPSTAYAHKPYFQADALSDIVKIGIFSDKPITEVIPMGVLRDEAFFLDRLQSRNSELGPELNKVLVELVTEQGQFTNLKERMRNVIIDAHNKIYKNNPNDYFVLWRGGKLNRFYPWQSMSKSPSSAQAVSYQMNQLYGAGDTVETYLIHKNNMIDLDALGLSFSNEQEIIVLAEAANKPGAKLEQVLIQDDVGKINVSDLPKNGFEIENISKPLADAGQASQDFFDDVVKGINEKYRPKSAYEQIIDLNNPDIYKWQDDYNKLIKEGGNFNQHIFTSIPTFYETQIIKGLALSNLLDKQPMPDNLLKGRYQVLDIGGTEGTWAKALAKNNPNFYVEVLDPLQKARDVFEEGELVTNAIFRNEAFSYVLDDQDKIFNAKEIQPVRFAVFNEVDKYDVVHESMAFQFMDKNRAEQIKFIKENLLNENGIIIIEEKFANNDAIYKANEELKNTFKSKYYTPEQIQDKKFNVLLDMEANQVSVQEIEKILGENFANVEQYWDAGNFKGYIASDSDVVNQFVPEINNLEVSLTNHRFSTAPTEKEVKVAVQNKIQQHGTDSKLAAQIAQETIEQSPQYFNKLSKIAARFGVVGGTALAGLAKLAPALAPGDFAIEKAIEKSVPYLDDAAAKLGFARIPFKNLLPTYIAYEIGVAGADIIQAAMYAYDKSQQLPKPSAAAFGSDTFQESLTRLLLPKAYEEEAIKRSQVPGDLLAFYQTPTGKRIVEEMKFGNQFMKELDQEKISKYSPGWGLTKGLLSILGELAQYEAPEVTLNSSDYTTKLKENPAMIYNAGITGSNK